MAFQSKNYAGRGINKFNGNTKARQQPPVDMLFIYNGIDPNRQIIFGKTSHGKNCAITINPEVTRSMIEYQAKNKKEKEQKAAYFTYLINADMQTEFDKINKKRIMFNKPLLNFMASNCKLKNIQNIDGIEYVCFTADAIRRIDRAEDLIHKPVTFISFRQDDVNVIKNTLAWEAKAISAHDTDGIEKFLKLLEICNKVEENSENNEYNGIKVGFQFRTLVKRKNLKDQDGKLIKASFYLVDNTMLYDYIKEIEAHVNRDSFLQIKSEYLDYVETELKPALKEKFGDDVDIVVEFAYYKSYYNGKFGAKNFKDTQTGSPFYQIAKTVVPMTFNSKPDDPNLNGCYGGRMYVYLSKNEQLDDMVIYKNFVSEIFPNIKYKDHICYYIESSAVSEIAKEHNAKNVPPEEINEYGYHPEKVGESSVRPYETMRPIFANAKGTGKENEAENSVNTNYSLNSISENEKSQSVSSDNNSNSADDVDDDIPF